MRYPLKYLLIFAAILMLAGLANFTGLDRRPMHNDEAVNAYKLGIMIETGEYRYDKNEYHGPVLYYASRILTGLLGQADFVSLTESSLRSVTAIFGIAVIIILFLLAESLGWITLLVTALLFALAPAMVFYSRYFIHEMLLVFFGFAYIITGYKYLVRKRLFWACLSGTCMGLMHATKETCIINYAAFGISAIIILFLVKRNGRYGLKGMNFPLWHLLVAMLIGGLVSITFYSSFFTNPQGIIDSITAYQVYFTRAGIDDAHLHPWYYYLDLLVHTKNPSGFFWSELWLLLLALSGFILIALKKNKKQGDYFILFIGFYTYLLMIIYSIISYKTPWNILQFYYGTLLLAGSGMVHIFRIRTHRWLKTGIAVLVLIGAVHWLYTSYSINFRQYSEPANPYVYAHTGEDVLDIAEVVSRVSQVHPDGREVHIEIIIPDNEYWPLPWYLRAYSNTAWWDHVEYDQPAAHLIIAAASVEKELIKKLYEQPPPGQRNLYISLFIRNKELRPGLELRTYVRKDLWDLLPEDLKSGD
ncbi:MAG: flippase activity-associated protein Agl23 [Bacteroidales bacterium]